ncbi:unnamed protein product [Clavelina lepadiformis]|uniref:[histone H3]-lysine(36) N-trimethyltransferase n=1 Tax=Clavelina lepadiformis TaxID=159417 RepID=A0ABP0F9L0_CLALP
MDKIDESSSSVKGVRLQGFKGFKLNRNHQLLIKPVFKQPNAKQSDRNATKTNSLANSALGNTNQNIPSIKLPSLPDSFSHLCPTSNAPFSEELPLKNQKNLQLDKRLPSVHENNFDDQIKEYSKKMGITETLKTSAVTSPLKANPYSDSTLDTPNLSPPDNSKRKSRYRSRSKSRERERSHSRKNKDRRLSRERKSWNRDSFSDHRSSRSRRDRRRSRSRSPKRRRRSNARDNFYRRSRHSRSRERNDRNSTERSSPRKSNDLKTKLQLSSGSRKRRASSSDSSNDDEEMKRARERRLKNSKSPETYSSRKKSCQSPDRISDANSASGISDVFMEISGTGRQASMIAEIGKRNAINKDKSKEKISLLSKESPKKLPKSKVTIASIGCWIGDDDDADDEDTATGSNVAATAGSGSENPLIANHNNNLPKPSPKPTAKQRNVFESILPDSTSDVLSCTERSSHPTTLSTVHNETHRIPHKSCNEPESANIISEKSPSTVTSKSESTLHVIPVLSTISCEKYETVSQKAVSSFSEDTVTCDNVKQNTTQLSPSQNMQVREELFSSVTAKIANVPTLSNSFETNSEVQFTLEVGAPDNALPDISDKATVLNRMDSFEKTSSDSSTSADTVNKQLPLQSDALFELKDKLSDSSSSSSPANGLSTDNVAENLGEGVEKKPDAIFMGIDDDWSNSSSNTSSKTSSKSSLAGAPFPEKQLLLDANEISVNSISSTSSNCDRSSPLVNEQSNFSIPSNCLLNPENISSSSSSSPCNMENESRGILDVVADPQNAPSFNTEKDNFVLNASDRVLAQPSDKKGVKTLQNNTNLQTCFSDSVSVDASNTIPISVSSTLFEKLQSKLMETSENDLQTSTVTTSDDKNIFDEFRKLSDESCNASISKSATHNELTTQSVDNCPAITTVVTNTSTLINIIASNPNSTAIKTMLPAKKRCHEWFKAFASESSKSDEILQSGTASNSGSSNFIPNEVGIHGYGHSSLTVIKQESKPFTSAENEIAMDNKVAVSSDSLEYLPSDAQTMESGTPTFTLFSNSPEPTRESLPSSSPYEPEYPTSTLLPGQQSPESPLFCADHMSPLHDFTLSDDPSFEHEDFKSMDIRIPIDNEEMGLGEETLEEQMPTSSTKQDLVLSAIPPSLSSNELSNGSVSDTSSSNKDDSEGRRRSARIKTKMEKRKPRLVRSTSQTPKSLDILKNNNKENSNMDIPASVTQQDSLNPFLSGFLQEADVNTISTNDSTTLPQFDMIYENSYLFVKKKSRARKEIRRMLCDCVNHEDDTKPPCGDDCLNRLLMIECSARCPFGDDCTNKRFQRREYVPTEVFQTDWKGWGLRAKENLAPSKLVMEYCGEVLNQMEFERRSQMYAEENQQHFYFMALGQDEVIDATTKGNTSRFINHSCDPNCETQKWTVNGQLRVGFFTIRNVAAGEEITFDYQFERYGKEAQKCYCGSSNCRGYLGKAPDDDDENKFEPVMQTVSSYAIDAERDKKNKRKKKKVQEFKENTMENEILRLSAGLQSTEQVLRLCRLMVRSDTTEQRLMCLDVLRKSDNQTLLRSFLQFHGLPLIWSWMVDVSGTPITAENASLILLKNDILSTLAIFPITNKNILDDSKVLSMVKRWAEEEVALQESLAEESAKTDFPMEPIEPASEVPIVESSEPTTEKNTAEVNELAKDNNGQNDADNANTNKTEDTSAQIEASQKVLELTASLLDSWKDLKEIYRIPKRQKSDEKTQGGDSERSAEEPSSSQASSPSVGNNVDANQNNEATTATSSRDDREKSPRHSRSRDREQSREHDRYRSRDRDRRSWRSPPRSRRRDDDRSRSSRHSSTEKDNKYAWLESGSSSRLTREEHRRQFERDVKHREEKKQESKEDVAAPSIWPQPAAAISTITSVQKQPPVLLPAQPAVTTQPMSSISVAPPPPTVTMPTFTPSGYSGNLIQINPTPVIQPTMMYAASQDQQLHIGPLQQQQLAYSTPQQFVHTAASISQQYLSTAATPQQGQPISVIGAQTHQPQIFQPQPSVIANPYLLQQPVAPSLQLPQQTTVPSNPGVTILGSQGGQAIVLLSAEQLQQLTGGQVAGNTSQIVLQQPVPVQQTLQPQMQTVQPLQQNLQPVQQVAQPQTVEIQQQQQTVLPVPTPAVPDPKSQGAPPVPKGSKSPPKDPRPPRLPPNWKTASDADGCVYYYHVITRQTQWEPPTWDASEEDMLGKKEGEMEISSPNQEDPIKKTTEKMATKAVIASGAEQAKKARETFRTKMSQHVVQCLGPYRKPDCKAGKITSTEDFKHLARKLTHNILMKEIKQVQVWEDLECNENVKHKAKEYVRKYMAKVGPVYKVKEDDAR